MSSLYILASKIAAAVTKLKYIKIVWFSIELLEFIFVVRSITLSLKYLLLLYWFYIFLPLPACNREIADTISALT